MRTGLAAAALLALAPGAAQALSCVNPADRAQGAEVVLIGEVVRTDPVRTYMRTPWPWAGEKAVQLTEYAAEVRTVEVVRGAGAPSTIRYLFRDKRIDCDFDPAVSPGQRVVLTLTRRRTAGGGLTAPDVVNAFTPEQYARLAAMPSN